jgi:hypothetical protein
VSVDRLKPYTGVGGVAAAQERPPFIKSRSSGQ